MSENNNIKNGLSLGWFRLSRVEIRTLVVSLFLSTASISGLIWKYKNQVDKNTQSILIQKAEIKGLSNLTIENSTDIKVLQQQQEADRRDIDRLYQQQDRDYDYERDHAK